MSLHYPHKRWGRSFVWCEWKGEMGEVLFNTDRNWCSECGKIIWSRDEQEVTEERFVNKRGYLVGSFGSNGFEPEWERRVPDSEPRASTADRISVGTD